MGLFLDIYLAYAFRLLVRVLRVRWAASWPIVPGTVLRVSSLPRGFGCPTVEIVYTYTLAGETYSALDESPFTSLQRAQEYAEKVSVGDRVSARVKPTAPGISILCRRPKML